MARSPLVRRLVRRLIWSDRTVELLAESGDTLAVRQVRWANALDRGSTFPLFVPTPRILAPENFADHMKQCRCSFWRWFLACGIDKEIRSVLDVGCGTGQRSHHFVGHGYDVTGVTFNPYEKEECVRRGMTILEDDFHFLTAPDNAFDLIVSSHSIEHSVSPLFALWEWKRVVRPGGYLFVTTPVAIEQDARAVYPKHYDPVSDTLSFTPPTETASGEDIHSREEGCASASTYANGSHFFVLSYWQLRWLFRVAGLELVAEGVEDVIASQSLGVEIVDGRCPPDPRRLLSALMLLRKPE